jgi:predicted AlkP superfamily phosphohydrolase/phosphomutase
MLTNSLLAGALGAAYLTVLVLQLNPQIPLLSQTTSRWYLTLSLFYGVHLAVTFYVVIVLREFFAFRVLSPGWASVRVLAWMGASAAAVAAVLMWLNVRGFDAALTEEAAWRMTAGAIATSASAVVLLGIAIAHYSFGRRGSRVGATLFALAVFASLALPLAARGRAVDLRPPISPVLVSEPEPAAGASPAPRVMMLLLDGASLDYVLPRVAEGRLPAFGRLLEKAAVMDLATVRPTQPDPVWAAVATGMYPSKNGVRSAAAYYARDDSRPVDLLPDHCFSHALVHLGFIRDQPNAATTWRARPLWSIASQAGVSVGIARWPLTYPAEHVNGFIVTDRFHQLVGSIAEFDRAASPPELLGELEATFAAPTPMEPEPASTRIGAESTPEGSALQRDRVYSRAMRNLSAQMHPRLTALRYEGLDTVGHYYLRYSQPRTFRDVPEEQRRRFAQVIDQYYAFIDDEVGNVLDTLESGDLLLIVSGFGMQPLNPVKKTVGRLLGDADYSGTHERAPDGFIIAYGTAIEPGRRQRGSIVDVTPTVLYFLGLAVARDMDGFARADLFNRAFTAERPIVFIPTYGS